MLDAVLTNARYSLRAAAKRPALSAIIIATLAIGIGANTAIFSLVYGMLLRPFPYAEAERLVTLSRYPMKSPDSEFTLSLAEAEDVRERSRGFDGLGAFQNQRVNLVGDGQQSTPINLTLITPDVFRVLGVTPSLGRNFLPEEDRAGGDVNKAILSHSLWTSRYGADPGIVGRQIRTAMTTYQVVGVMPAGFGFPGRADVWVTAESGLALRRENRFKDRNRGYRVIARLKRDVSLPQAQTGLDTAGRDLQRLYPATNSESLFRLQSLRDAETKRLRPYLLLLACAVALVLLICCANVSNLLLAQASARQREITIWAALGATRQQIVTRLLSESLLLALAGGGAGLALAFGLVKLFPRLLPEDLPVWMQVGIDPAVLAFTALVAMTSGVVFGLAPAWQSARVNLIDVMKEGSRGGSIRSGWLKRGLVVAEVALSLVLLVSATLLMKSFQTLLAVDPGFSPDRVITVSVSPYRPGTNEERIERVAAYYRTVLQRLSELPDVVAVGGTDNFPFTGERVERNAINIEAKGDDVAVSQIRAPSNFVDITPDYFEAMGIPLLEGRRFTEADRQQSHKVMILSETAAKTLFPGRSALGQQVRAGTPGHWDPWATVVGVAGNVKYRQHEDRRTLELYYPYTQYGLGTAHLAIRARGGNPLDLERRVRETIAAVDPETAVNEIKPLRSLIDETLWQQRLWGWLLAAFAGVALLLSVIGIYGVMSFLVTQRTRELGIRLAIGEQPLSVLRLVLGSGLRLAGAGVVVGLLLAYVANGLLQGMLFGVSATDPLAYFAVPALLLAVATAACLAPAWRAAHIDPVTALRRE